MLARKSCNGAENRDKERPIKVYARVRPLGTDEIERNEAIAVETFDDAKRIKIIDTKHSQETTYHFDGVFTGRDANEKVFKYTAKHLTVKLLNGMNCAVLAYGQTGSGKTYTLMADGCITEYAIHDLYKMIDADRIHSYKITCSFVQIYLEKVFDLLSAENKDELPVREHPTRGIYVKDLSHHRVQNTEDILDLFRRGKQELITAETKMVRHSSRSHSIFQISIERRLDISKKNELIKTVECELAESVMLENIPGDIVLLEEEMVLRGKMDICDLAGSERLGKTMVEGINRSEAKYINSSLLQLGNVIYALSEGKRRHIPFRNSTLTRLLQECLGSKCITSFIICAAPSASEAYETRCSLNFGTRARTITNKERMLMNVEVDYKLLTKRLSKRIFQLESELNKKLDDSDWMSSTPEIHTRPHAETQTETVAVGDSNSVTCASEQGNPFSENVKHLLGISEMLEILVEGNEKINKQCNKSYDSLKDNSSSNVVSIFNIATQQISNILAELPEKVELRNGYTSIDLVAFISQCSQILESFQSELLETTTTSENTDFYADTAFAIFDLCGDTKKMIKAIAKGGVTNEQIEEEVVSSGCGGGGGGGGVDGGGGACSGADTWQREVNFTLENYDLEFGDRQQLRNIRYIFYLTNLLQIFQVIRLLVEEIRSSRLHQIHSMPVKPYKWSTSVEDVTSSDVGNNTVEEMEFSDGLTSETDTSGFKLLKPKHKIGFEEGKEGMNEKKPYRSKLSRKYSMKVKKDDPSQSLAPSEDDNAINYNTKGTDFTTSKPSSSRLPYLSRSKTFDSFDHRMKRNQVAEDSAGSYFSESVDNEHVQLNIRISDIQQKHDELWEKYKKVVQENGSMISKIKSLEQEKNQLKTERDYLHNQLETCYETIKEKEEEIERTQKDFSQMKMKLQMSEEKIFENRQSIGKLEQILEEREEAIANMKSENKSMSAKIDEYAKNEKVLIELQRELEKAEVKYQQCKDHFKTFSEEILCVSGIVDVVKFQESRRQTMSNIEDITSLESEFFNALECNVQYEAALCDVRAKVRLYLLNECGINHFPDDLTLHNRVDKAHAHQNKITASPQSNPSKSPSELKRTASVKLKQKKRLNELKKTCCDKPVSAAKEIKACRASRIKELLHEKVKLNDRIDKLEKELSMKDVESRQSQGQIDVLIRELGNLDLELSSKPLDPLDPNGTNPTLTSYKELSFMDISCLVSQDKNLELIGIPEINYKEFMAYVNNISSNGGDKLQCTGGKPDDETSTTREVENLHNELELYKGKYHDMENMYKKLKKKVDQDELATENQSLQRRLEYLQHSNTILDEENQSIKSVIRERKVQIKDLRQRNMKLCEELESYKHQYMTTKAKGDTNKLQLEKKLTISKEKVISLENYIKQLTSELQAQKRKRLKKNGSFNDSGLPNEDSDS